MSRSHMPHIPSLTIGLSLFIMIGWVFRPSTDVLYLLAFVLMVVVVEITYRRMDREIGR
jgi:hypothetical protein